MRSHRNLLWITACTAGALLLNSCQTEPTPLAPTEPAPSAARVGADADQYIVTFKDEILDNLPPLEGYDAQKQRALEFVQVFLRQQGITSVDIQRAYGSVILGFAGKMPASVVTRLQANPLIESVEADGPVSFDEPAAQDVRAQDAQTVPWGISAVGGFVNYTGTGVAWVLDTGIDLDHPDLNVNAARGFNAMTGTDALTLDDQNGHGTHVSGTIAAKNDAIGVVGVAAGAPVIPVKVLGASGGGTWSGVIDGINYVGANGKRGDVANMSLGGGANSSVDRAVQRAAGKGIYFSLAAGNSSANARNSSPARANGSNIRTVSAHDVNSRFATFSNWGNPPIEYAAPGVGVFSTYMNGTYASLSGTSMAAPHVAGIMLANGRGTVYRKGRVTGDFDNNADYKASRVR